MITDHVRGLELVKELFPDSCPILYDDAGMVSGVAVVIIENAIKSEFSRNPIEHPCYGCRRRRNECSVRQVAYHDGEHRFLRK